MSVTHTTSGEAQASNEACGTMRTPFAPSSGWPSRLTTIERNGDSAWPPCSIDQSRCTPANRSWNPYSVAAVTPGIASNATVIGRFVMASSAWQE